MLNVTFAGDIFDSAGSQYISDEVAYQAFYYSSGLTKWNDIHFSELGKYNINLGDGDFLTQSGNYSPGDKVVICFWTDNTKTRSDMDLTEWSFVEIELSSLNVYLNTAQTKPIQNPICNFTTFGNIILDNVDTTNDQIWMFSGVEQYQEHIRYGEVMFDIMSFPPDCVTIDWGDTNIDVEDLEDEYPHEYDLAGDYHIAVTVQNRGGLICTSEMDVQATFNIVPGLTWPMPVWRNNEITFTPNITGDIGEITDVSYAVNGTYLYTGLNYDQGFFHTFNTPGPHIITQKITYDNVFEISEIEQNFTVYLDTIANFYKGDGQCGPDFIDNSIVGNGSITNYYWSVEFNGINIAEHESSTSDSWEYNWPYIGTFKVVHKVKDSEGSEFGIERIFEVDECPGSKVEVIGGGGGGWAQTVYVDKPLPTLKLKKLEEIDERVININVKVTLLNE